MKNKPEIILIGGGGHCKAVIDVIEAENRFKIAGIIDIPEKTGQKILGYEIIGSDNDIPVFAKKNYVFFITVGHIKSASVRVNLFNKIKSAGGILPVIISPSAHVSKHSEIDDGTIIMHHTIINAGSKIGKNCIINNKALIEHDCIIGDNCHISTNATINGSCVIDREIFIGSSSVLYNNISIVSNTIIGAGAVVTIKITTAGIYAGNPARKIK